MAAPTTPTTAPANRSTLQGTLVIALIALLFWQGLPWLNSRIPDAATIPGGTRIPLGRGVSYATAAGWAEELSKAKPNETSSLVRETAVFTITTLDWQSNERDLVDRAKQLFEGAGQFHVYGPEVPFKTDGGYRGVHFAIHGGHTEGRVWLVLLKDHKHAIAARLRGAPGYLQTALRDAEAMLDSIRVEATP
jgi:hypothetical protein